LQEAAGYDLFFCRQFFGIAGSNLAVASASCPASSLASRIRIRQSGITSFDQATLPKKIEITENGEAAVDGKVDLETKAENRYYIGCTLILG